MIKKLNRKLPQAAIIVLLISCGVTHTSSSVAAQRSTSVKMQILPLECVFDFISDGGSGTIIYITPQECGVPPPTEPQEGGAGTPINGDSGTRSPQFPGARPFIVGGRPIIVSADQSSEPPIDKSSNEETIDYPADSDKVRDFDSNEVRQLSWWWIIILIMIVFTGYKMLAYFKERHNQD